MCQQQHNVSQSSVSHIRYAGWGTPGLAGTNVKVVPVDDSGDDFVADKHVLRVKVKMRRKEGGT